MKNWKIYAGIGVVLLLLTARGGLMMLQAGLRFLLPAAVVYLGYKMVKKALLPEGTETARKGEAPVIEICPKCGEEKKTRHRCAER